MPLNVLFDNNRDHFPSLFPSNNNDIISCNYVLLVATPLKIIFNDPATIVFWMDGSKTVVKAMKGTEFNPYHGFCAALAKKVYGSNSRVKEVIEQSGSVSLEQPIHPLADESVTDHA